MICHLRHKLQSILSQSQCPGFGQDRVSFHQKPGGDTAWPADPNCPNKQGIGHHVPSCWVPSGGAGQGLEGGKSVAAGRAWGFGW